MIPSSLLLASVLKSVPWPAPGPHMCKYQPIWCSQGVVVEAVRLQVPTPDYLLGEDTSDTSTTGLRMGLHYAVRTTNHKLSSRSQELT